MAYRLSRASPQESPFALAASSVICSASGPLRIGGQSYAFGDLPRALPSMLHCVCSLSPAILSRLPLRIPLGGGTAIAQRVYVWNASGTDDTFLRPMANYIKVNRKASDGGATEVAEALCDASARGDVAAFEAACS